MTYRFRPGVRLVPARAGEYLLSERPLRAVRLSEGLAGLLRRTEDGEIETEDPAGQRTLEALAVRGLLERRGSPLVPEEELPSVSVVIPVRDRAAELRRCLEGVWGVDYPRDRLEVVVVDDGSIDESSSVAREAGVDLVPSGGMGLGPGVARNRGVAAASGEVLAFIDSDCVPSPRWLRELVPWFADLEVAAVGGLVEGLQSARRLDRYEAAMSSLSLGARERSAGEGDDTFYLPSCNLLVRREAFRAAGGFRAGMHVGEDVDLSWRLRDRGGKLVYCPRGAVRHEHRSRLWPFLKRRFQYGTSEGALQTFHPRRRKRLVLPPLLTAALGLAALAPLLGAWSLLAATALALVWDAAGFHRRLSRAGLALRFPTVVAARARALGSLAYYVAYHLVRYYGWPLLGAALAWARLGFLAALLAALAAGVDWTVRRPRLSFPAFAVFYLAEHLSYGLGVFWGCWRQGTFDSYRPAVHGRAPAPAG
ncbi:MAG: mycofactocin biosynthesis glycosyltransferase MftF [Deltaproteobacteria bacterium]|nr:mycofactocin biosynthesis glycosyltransferase MftF [Deltaproteobacteria bacterium]